MLRLLLGLVLVTSVVGCRSTINQGTAHAPGYRVFVAPYVNATDDDHAGQALTQLTASALIERGIVPVELPKAQVKSTSGETLSENPVELARSLNIPLVLVGTVHEYRYKTDLDGDPAVGISMQLIDAASGQVIWRGSSGKVNILFASLTKTAQKSVTDLVDRIPWQKVPELSASAQ